MYFSQTSIQALSRDNEWCMLHQMLVVDCLTSQEHACLSRGWICSDSCMCCHTETVAADWTSYLIQSQYVDIGPTSSSADPVTPDFWHSNPWSTDFEVIGMTRPGKRPMGKQESNPDVSLSRHTPYHLASEAVCHTWTASLLSETWVQDFNTCICTMLWLQ